MKTTLLSAAWCTLFASVLLLSPTVLTAQSSPLIVAGELPHSTMANKVLVYVNGDCSYRALNRVFAVLTDLNYRVLLDGERQRVHSGLVTSVTVADTTFNRRSQDLVIRRIHATEQPDYVLTITGDYRVMAVAHLDMRVIGFQTGELFAHAAAVSSVANTRYSAMEQALREMFGRGKG